MATNTIRIIKHDTVDDKQGHHYDIYWVEQGSGINEIGLLDAERLPTVATAAALTDGTLTTPTVTLFYQSTGIRLTGGTAGDRIAVVARRDVGSAGAGSTTPPNRLS
jgi:hypothetical protein